MATSFTETLKSLKTNYANDDLDWVRFVHDHYDVIFADCKVEPLEHHTHYWEKYRLVDYLREKGYDPNIAWIVMMVNQMESEMDFHDMESILIPQMVTLRGVWRSFLQYRAHVNAIRG